MSKKSTLATALAERLYARILRKGLGPGDYLGTQQALADDFGVSHGTMREAIGRLRGQGVLSGKRRHGLVVEQPSPFAFFGQVLPLIITDETDISDLYEFRIAVELGALPIVVSKATDKQLDKIAATIPGKDELDALSPQQLNNLDRQFHEFFLEASGNSFLIQMKQVIDKFFSVRWPTGPSDVGHNGNVTTVKSHKGILDAIRGRNIAAAVETLADHLMVYKRFQKAPTSQS